jgi:hypothetical protein
VTDLDTLARSATRELLDRTAPDVPTRYTELRRIRTRRTAGKLVAVAAAVALAAGGWQLAGSHPKQVTPAPPPTRVSNGALLAVHNEWRTQGWMTILGERPALMPTDIASGVSPAMLQFTSNGSSAVYTDHEKQLALWDLTTGTKEPLAPCPGGSCWGLSVSPDLSTMGYVRARVVSGVPRGGLRLQSIATGEVTELPVNLPVLGPPAWSPDGEQLAFTSNAALYTMAADGSHLRRIYTRTKPTDLWTNVAWSPDSSRIAFFDTTMIRVKGRDYPVSEFTAMTVRADGSDPTILGDAGHCVCISIMPPTLTWSPDGSLVAVATAEQTPGQGVYAGQGIYTVHPDGTGWTKQEAGSFYQPVWQPVIE